MNDRKRELVDILKNASPEEKVVLLHQPEYDDCDIIMHTLHAYLRSEKDYRHLHAMMTWRGYYDFVKFAINEPYGTGIINFLFYEYALYCGNVGAFRLLKLFVGKTDRQAILARRVVREYYPGAQMHDSALVFSFCILIESALLCVQ